LRNNPTTAAYPSRTGEETGRRAAACQPPAAHPANRRARPAFSSAGNSTRKACPFLQNAVRSPRTKRSRNRRAAGPELSARPVARRRRKTAGRLRREAARHPSRTVHSSV